jgi:hypothetical protein
MVVALVMFTVAMLPHVAAGAQSVVRRVASIDALASQSVVRRVASIDALGESNTFVAHEVARRFVVAPAGETPAASASHTNQFRARKLRKHDGFEDGNLTAVLDGCGEICDLSIPHVPRKSGLDIVRKKWDCTALFKNLHSDAPASSWPPPPTLPQEMVQHFSMNGAAQMDNRYMTQRFSGAKDSLPRWDPKYINKTLAMAAAGNLKGTYGRRTTNQVLRLLRRHSKDLNGKHVAVIGSVRPWMEALLLDVGARHVTTIEYRKIVSEDPRISTLTPADARERYLKSGGAEPRFDAVASFSSVEHSGLGRYGDSLNPWGDLQAVAKAWCMTKPQGLMFMGVPQGNIDFVHYNAHRVYGPKRYPQLMANWEQIDKEGNLFGDGELQTPVAFRRMEMRSP